MGWVDKQVNNVKRFVSNPGKSVNNLFKDVGNTVTNLLKDPKALAVLAINIYAPGAGSAIGAAMGITNATAAAFIGNTVLNTALNGGDVNAAAKSAALQIGGQKLADTVTAGLADTAISTATKQLIGNTAASATIAAIQGKDPMAAIAAGGISYGVSAITSQYDGFDKLPAASQKAVRTVLTGALSGAKDAKITSDLVYGAIGSGIQAYKNVSDGNAATQKELGRDLTDEEAKKLALYSSANTASTDIKNLVVGEKSAKAIESGQSSYTYDGKPVAVSGTDINNYFKDKLTTAGITPTAADISAASTAYSKSKDAAGATNAVIDSRSVDAQEVKDIYAKEGITNPTADIISKYVKSNVDEATALADIQKQADAQYTTKQEVTDAFKDTGYTPTDADIAKFEGAKPEAMQLETVKAYTQIVDAFKKEQTDPTQSTEIAKLAFQTVMDPRFMTRLPDGNVLIDTSNAPLINGLPELPAVHILLNKADTDQLNYVPEFDETKYDVLQAIQKSNPNIKVDDLITGSLNAMKDQGYVPSIEELLDAINQPKDKTQANVNKAASDYADNKIINKDEAKQYLIDNGIAKPTDEQINQFVKKGNEADIKKEIDSYANPLATTAAEAEQLLKAAGISKPTKEQIAMFTKEGLQATTETALNTYTNPLVTTATEAEQMLKDAGITKPTKEQIAMFTKEGLQTDTQKALSGYTNPLVTTAQEVKDMFAKIGYTDPTQEEIDRYTGEKPEAVQLDMAKTYGAAALAQKQYVGTKKKDVTQADIDLMTQMVSGKAAGDTRYDVTGDKKVTQEDIDYLSKYLGTGTNTGTGTGTDTFKPGMGTYWAPTGLYGEIYGNHLAQEAAATKAAAEKDAADKAAAIKLAADKVTAAKNLKQQTFANNVMMNMAANAPSGNVSTVAQPVSTVEAAPVFDFEHPLDIGFFNQQANTQKDTQDQPGVVKIAQGGYMDMFHPHEAGGMDEILRILEGK
jgi:hypothetical protein